VKSGPNKRAPSAMDEVQTVRKRLGDGVRDQGVIERLDRLVGLLDSAPGVLHFACHNKFTDQTGSVITLEGGPLRPSDLAVLVQKEGLSAPSPLVFFNACRTAAEIPGLMHMMGWAQAIYGRWGRRIPRDAVGCPFNLGAGLRRCLLQSLCHRTHAARGRLTGSPESNCRCRWRSHMARLHRLRKSVRNSGSIGTTVAD
jgi:hypothetical protein